MKGKIRGLVTGMGNLCPFRSNENLPGTMIATDYRGDNYAKKGIEKRSCGLAHCS